ncbi:hypothetical protein HYDPIDRAFT_176263 [Hydnomerulius pinastri MD-312]|uniref:Uncharacterized protein n=1 Tax=Hydnomerulius pinastri MD-312 TaxID=994086 RepID=A0A0C9VAX9_9AGAM|nr:hypothetical protein HYDPIDRAFT_176263 [Hydnomerulius pinastri MD-312]
MKTTFASLALFVAGALAQLTINTPGNVVECQPTLLSWSGGTGDILPGSTPTAAALENLGQQNSTSVTWTCNIAAGVSIGLTLRDSTGTVAQSAPFTINPGSSITCLNTTSLAPGPSVSAPGSSASAPSTSTPAGASPTTAKPTSATGTSPSTAPSTGAASSNAARVGAAGVVGAAVAALLF